MNLDVHPWSQINAIKKNISDAKLQEFVFQLHGTVMDLTTVMIIPMNRTVDQFYVQTISLNARTLNASSKRMFVMEKMIVETIQMSLMNTLAFHRLSDVLLGSGNVPE